MENDVQAARKVVTIRTPRLIIRGATLSDSDIDGMHIAFSDPVVMRYWSNPAYTSREQTVKWISSMMANDRNGATDFLICERKQDSNPSSSFNTESSVNCDPSPSQNKTTVVLDGSVKLEDEGEVIGKIGVWSGNEIGFLLRRSYWGGGLAKEALVAVLDYLFSLPQFSSSPSTATRTSLGATDDQDPKEDSLPSGETGGVDWIMADVDPRNQASLGILKKFGFQEYDFKERTALIGGEWVDSVYLKITREIWMKRTRS